MRINNKMKEAGQLVALLLAAFALGLSAWACTAKGAVASTGEVGSSEVQVSQAADSSLPEEEPQTLAEKYGVAEDVMDRYFPEGIPEGLTDEQIRAILRGEGVEATLDGVHTVFNPEAWYASQEAE